MINAVKLIHEPNCVPNRFDGLGLGHNTMGLSKMYYQLFSQTLENVKLVNNPMFLFKKGAGIDTRQLVAKPGGGIAVDGEGPLANNIQPVQFPDLKQGAVQLLQQLDDAHKRATGATDIFTGDSFSRNQGVQQATMGAASQRFDLINRRFKHALADVANMILKMEIQNLQSPDAAILRIFSAELRGQVYQVLINEGKDVKYNIKVKGETNVAKNKDVQIKQLIDTYNLFGGILPPANQMEFCHKILELRGIDEIDKLVPDPQQFAQQQQMMQQQQAMQQPGAINGQMMPQPGQGINPQDIMHSIQAQTYGR